MLGIAVQMLLGMPAFHSGVPGFKSWSFESSFLLVCIWEVASDGPSTRVPAIHMENSDAVPDS